MKTAKVLGEAYFRRNSLIAFLLLLAVLASGIRFSDGSMLLAISGGADITHPIFQENPSSQYIFDSPLKVLLLRTLPQSYVVISFAFLLISFAPLALLALPLNNAQRKSILLVFLLAPILKVSIQNVGVGDGVIITCILILVAYQNLYASFLLMLMIGLWHPQQAFFIFSSLLLVDLIFSERITSSTKSAFLGAMSAGCIFLIYRNSLGFEYLDRQDYMQDNLITIFSNNGASLPAFLVPLITTAYISWPAISRLAHFKLMFLACYVILLVLLSSLTTDFSRVFFIISLPLVYALFSRSEIEILSRKFFFASLIIIASPIVSWSGLDIFLYKDVLDDACEWGGVCF